MAERDAAMAAAARRVVRLQALTRLNRIVSSSLGLDDVLREIARAATVLMDVPVGSFWLADETTGTLEAHGFSADGLDADCSTRRPGFEQGGVGWVATHRRPLNVPSVFDDERFVALDWERGHGLPSFYGAPVLLGGSGAVSSSEAARPMSSPPLSLVAVLAMNGRIPFRFGTDEELLLESLIALAAVAIRTARLHAGERASRARREELLARSPAVIYSCEPTVEHPATWVSANVHAQFGWEARHFLDDPCFFENHLHPDDAARFSGGKPAVLETGRHVGEYRFRRPDGSYRWMRCEQALVRDAEGSPVEIVGHALDITDRKVAQEQAERRQRQADALSRRLVEVQEEERRAIARELHDEIGQELTAVKLTLQMSARTPRDPSLEHVGEALRVVDGLIGRVRELSLDLRPAILDDLGLRPALSWHFGRHTARTGVRVTFTHAGIERRFSAAVETAASRIVQETLTNVARHAGVGEVEVRLEADEVRLALRVEDHGRGFDPAAVDGTASSGLAGMRERAALLGGGLAIVAAPGAGVRVTAELPLGPGGASEGGT